MMIEFNGERILDAVLAGNTAAVRPLLATAEKNSTSLYEMFKEEHYIKAPRVPFLDRVRRVVEVCRSVAEGLR